MELLKVLEGIRTPFLNEIMSIITVLGDETFFMVVGMIMLWCVSKKWGYRLMLIGMTGTAFNQLLKYIFLIPRPWVLDPTFTIVESAREGATGSSFPSGHTHSAVSVFGTLAMWMIWLFPALTLLFLPAAITSELGFLYILFGVSGPAFVCSRLLRDIFDKVNGSPVIPE